MQLAWRESALKTVSAANRIDFPPFCLAGAPPVPGKRIFRRDRGGNRQRAATI
jgi:hypothetical protein